MVLAQALVLLPDFRNFPQIKRNPQRIERRAPDRSIRESAGNDDQAVGLLPAVAGALVGDVGGGRRAFEEHGALAVVARPDLQHGPGKTQPVRAVIRRHRDDLAEDLHPGAEIIARKRGVGLAPQRRRGLADGARFTLDLGFQLDRRVGEGVTPEAFIGREGGNGQCKDKRSCEASANERKHAKCLQCPSGGGPDGVCR